MFEQTWKQRILLLAHVLEQHWKLVEDELTDGLRLIWEYEPP